MQPCDCPTRPTFFDVHPDTLSEFLAGFDKLSADRRAIYHLYRCPTCQTLWLVDDMTRGPIAVRVQSEAASIDFDERPYRRELAIAMHGGLDEGRCMFMGCHNRPLRGRVICVDHQYPAYAGGGPAAG
jgi:hypothetical protein